MILFLNVTSRRVKGENNAEFITDMAVSFSGTRLGNGLLSLRLESRLLDEINPTVEFPPMHLPEALHIATH